MADTAATSPAPPRAARPDNLHTLWLIARRGAIESLRDRLTVGFNIFFVLILPPGLAATVIHWQVNGLVAEGRLDQLGTSLAVYFLSIGLFPATGAVGSAAGQFAGEKEQGSLAPLLASPASNFAIFGGKILGAILPTFLFAFLAELMYIISLTIVIGPDKVRLLPPGTSLALIGLIPPVSVFAAAVTSLISSRVRTYNAAQQVGGLALVPFWGGVFALSLRLQAWGAWALIAALVGLILIDAALIVLGAATWRREEVLAQR